MLDLEPAQASRGLRRLRKLREAPEVAESSGVLRRAHGGEAVFAFEGSVGRLQKRPRVIPDDSEMDSIGEGNAVTGSGRNVFGGSSNAKTPEHQSIVGLRKPCLGSMVARVVVAESGQDSMVAGANAASVTSKRQDRCDKCDGPHCTKTCPVFKKARSAHKDAWVNHGSKRPSQISPCSGKCILRGGRVVHQPPDGSCLFHSLCFGLNRGESSGDVFAAQLRRDLAQFIRCNSQLEISGDTLQEWVRWDTNSSVEAYARRMASRGWGGGIEMAACCLLKKVNIHVYKRRKGGVFERISHFDSPVPTERTIEVVYQGGVHYDALEPCC